MKKFSSILSMLSVTLLLAFTTASFAQATNEADAARSIKPHHQALGFQCATCHKSTDISQYKPLGTEDCLGCHGSAEIVAQRTDHLDAKAKGINPHRSIHDRTDLDCYECHAEHKPSTLLCSTCHDNTNEWFKPTP